MVNGHDGVDTAGNPYGKAWYAYDGEPDVMLLQTADHPDSQTVYALEEDWFDEPLSTDLNDPPYDDDIGFPHHLINPATGLMMEDAAFDVCGNPYGVDLSANDDEISS